MENKKVVTVVERLIELFLLVQKEKGGGVNCTLLHRVFIQVKPVTREVKWR